MQERKISKTVIALSIGLYPLNLMNWSMIAKHLIKLLPCLSGFSLLPPPLKRSINNYFLMSFAWQKIIHFQPPSLHHKNHLLITILPYTWQNTKILFNLLPFLSSDFHYLLLIFHKSAQALFLTSYNPNKILIARTALHQLSVLYHPLIKQPQSCLLFRIQKIVLSTGLFSLNKRLK